MNPIFSILNDKEQDALVCLAKRANPNNYNIFHWRMGFYCDDEDGEQYSICLICNDKIGSSLYNYDVYEHGVKHLKEKGLLPFV